MIWYIYWDVKRDTSCQILPQIHLGWFLQIQTTVSEAEEVRKLSNFEHVHNRLHFFLKKEALYYFYSCTSTGFFAREKTSQVLGGKIKDKHHILYMRYLLCWSLGIRVEKVKSIHLITLNIFGRSKLYLAQEHLPEEGIGIHNSESVFHREQHIQSKLARYFYRFQNLFRPRDKQSTKKSVIETMKMYDDELKTTGI